MYETASHGAGTITSCSAQQRTGGCGGGERRKGLSLWDAQGRKSSPGCKQCPPTLPPPPRLSHGALSLTTSQVFPFIENRHFPTIPTCSQEVSAVSCRQGTVFLLSAKVLIKKPDWSPPTQSPASSTSLRSAVSALVLTWALHPQGLPSSYYHMRALQMSPPCLLAYSETRWNEVRCNQYILNIFATILSAVLPGVTVKKKKDSLTKITPHSIVLVANGNAFKRMHWYTASSASTDSPNSLKIITKLSPFTLLMKRWVHFCSFSWWTWHLLKQENVLPTRINCLWQRW